MKKTTGQQIICGQDFSGLRLDKFLCQKFDISFSLASKLLREKKILLNQKKTDGSSKIKEGDEINFLCELDLRSNKAESNKDRVLSLKMIEKFWQNCLYEDEFLVAIDKPSGLASQGGSGILVSVEDYAKAKNYHLLHRLDKDTSGVLLLAKDPKTAEEFRDKFRNRQIKKTYLALICGKPSRQQIKIDIPLLKMKVGNSEKVFPNHENGKPAITELLLINFKNGVSMVELSPITGRTHQLRVHCKEIGHPIVNDVKYGGLKTLVFRAENLGSAQLSRNSSRNSQNLAKDPAKSTTKPLINALNKSSKNLPKLPRQRLCLHAKKVEINDYFGKKLIITSKNPDFTEF